MFSILHSKAIQKIGHFKLVMNPNTLGNWFLMVDTMKRWGKWPKKENFVLPKEYKSSTTMLKPSLVLTCLIGFSAFYYSSYLKNSLNYFLMLANKHLNSWILSLNKDSLITKNKRKASIYLANNHFNFLNFFPQCFHVPILCFQMHFIGSMVPFSSFSIMHLSITLKHLQHNIQVVEKQQFLG